VQARFSCVRWLKAPRPDQWLNLWTDHKPAGEQIITYAELPPAALVSPGSSAVPRCEAMALARPVCRGPDGTSALRPRPEQERDPGHRGGETVLPGPTPTRLAALGHSAAGLLQQHARVEAGSKGNFLCSQPRAPSCGAGCHERGLRKSSAPGDVLARDQDFSDSDGQVWRGARRKRRRESSSAQSVGRRRESCGRQLAQRNCGVRRAAGAKWPGDIRLVHNA